MLIVLVCFWGVCVCWMGIGICVVGCVLGRILVFLIFFMGLGCFFVVVEGVLCLGFFVLISVVLVIVLIIFVFFDSIVGVEVGEGVSCCLFGV